MADTKPLCPVNDYRRSLSDDDFWAFVLLGERPGDDADGPDIDDLTSNQGEPCAECGERGACGYDMEGRPMVHIPEPDDEEEL